MEFEQPLREGRFIRRYKRFFAEIEFEGEVITAHCPNTGSMKGCQDEGTLCRFSSNDDPKRKLKHTLEMVKTSDSWVGVHTGRPNKMVWELWERNLSDKLVPHWKNFDRAQSEVKINDQSRLDMMLWSSDDHEVKKWKPKSMETPSHLIEVKNVTMRDGNKAVFPDAVTTRGQKHIQELMDLQTRGFTTEMVYVIGRQDCDVFSPADVIDPEYGKRLREAQKQGVRLTAFCTEMTADAIFLNGKTLPIEL